MRLLIRAYASGYNQASCRWILPGSLVSYLEKSVFHEVLDHDILIQHIHSNLMYNVHDTRSRTVLTLYHGWREKEVLHSDHTYWKIPRTADPGESLDFHRYLCTCHYSTSPHHRFGFPRGGVETLFLYKGECSSANVKPTPQAPTSPGAPHRHYSPTSSWDLNDVSSYLITAMVDNTAKPRIYMKQSGQRIHYIHSLSRSEPSLLISIPCISSLFRRRYCIIGSASRTSVLLLSTLHYKQSSVKL
jgi:hypothetical protein